MTTITQDLILRIRRLPPALQYAAIQRLRNTPPPPGMDYPKIADSVWQYDPYHKLWGGWDMPQTAYGKEWGATGEGPGHENGMVLVDPYGQGMHVGRLLDNCRIAGLNGLDCSMKFGMRVYEEVDLTIRKTEFVGAFLEHYIYPSLLRGGLFEDCRFGRIGAANAGGGAIHESNRNIQEGGHDYTMECAYPEQTQIESTRIYRRCEFLHIGRKGTARFGAFAVEEPSAQLKYLGVDTQWINTHIRFEECTFIGGHLDFLDGNQVHVASSRAILCNHRPSLTIDNTYIDYPDPLDGWLGRVAYVPQVRIIRGPNSLMRGGKLEIVGAESINIDPNIPGDTKLLIRDGAGSTVYEGPVAVGYKKGVK